MAPHEVRAQYVERGCNRGGRFRDASVEDSVRLCGSCRRRELWRAGVLTARNRDRYSTHLTQLDVARIRAAGPSYKRDRVLPLRRLGRPSVTPPATRAFRIRLPGRRFSWPLLLLLASLGATAVAAFNAQRAVRSHQRTADRLLRDYASFTAWTSQRQVVDGLDGAVMASLQYIMHGREPHMFQRNGPRPNADDLWRYYNGNDRFRTRFCTPKRCPESFPPSVYFGFTLGADTLRVGTAGSGARSRRMARGRAPVGQAVARGFTDDAHPQRPRS